MHNDAPVPPAQCTTMKEVREGVDYLDRQLVALIAERSRPRASSPGEIPCAMTGGSMT